MAEQEQTKRLTAQEAGAKVIECRDLARQAMKPEHRTMLEHMAETWGRIAADLMARKTGNPR